MEFKSHGGVDYHVKAQHIKEMVECPVCLKTLPKLNLASHQIAVHTPKTPCNICGKLVSKIKVHMDTMHVDDSDMKTRCAACGKGFSSDQKLRGHNMSVHLKLRPYKCRYGCEQAFNDSSNRGQHERRAHGVVGGNCKCLNYKCANLKDEKV
jgi:hypothetical protein